MRRKVFITGGTGYIGSRLIPLLCGRGHEVTALVRAGSERKISTECSILVGDALQGDSYGGQLIGFDTFIHLVGVSHPSPAKAREFVSVDLRSAQEAIRVASAAKIPHFIYVSVAQPAPVMKAYLEVRSACETSLRAAGLNATVLRPWYVLGPGHRWPLLLKPLYAIAKLFPSTRDGALRLGLVTIGEMLQTLVAAVETPSEGVTILGVPEIRSSRSLAQ